jgi:hypothetical protein
MAFAPRFATLRGHASVALAALASAVAAPAFPASLAVIDPGPVTGPTAMAIGGDGLPVVVYRSLAGKLRVAKCQDRDCRSVQRTELPGPYLASQHVALATAADGNPLIAFREDPVQRLVAIKCATADCTGGGYQFRVIDDSSASVGSHVDVAVGPDGRAAFAYHDFNQESLKLARCESPACQAPTIEVVYGGGGGLVAGEYAALAFGGRAHPALATRWRNTAGSSGVNYFDCSMQPCIDSRASIHYMVSNPVGLGVDIAIPGDDRPVLAYIDQTTTALRFARCGDPACSSRTLILLDDSQFNLALDDSPAIAVRPDGRSVVAYQKSISVVGGLSGLFVAQCRTEACTSSDLIPIDQRVGVGAGTGMDADMASMADGSLVLSYLDASALQVKLAICNPATCEGPGDRLFQHGFQ